MMVPPKHPKMIIFSRKTHGCWVPSFLETSISPCLFLFNTFLTKLATFFRKKVQSQSHVIDGHILYLKGSIAPEKMDGWTRSTIRTLLHGNINPKDSQVFSLGDVGFLQFFRVVSGDYGKPCWKTMLSLTGLWGS